MISLNYKCKNISIEELRSIIFINCVNQVHCLNPCICYQVSVEFISFNVLEPDFQRKYNPKHSQSFCAPHCLTGRPQASSSGQYAEEDLPLGVAGSAGPVWCCQKQSAAGQQPGRSSVPTDLARQ